MTKIKKNRLSVFALVMLITVSIDSIRNLPATALFGQNLIFFFFVATVFFLVPTALVSAELSSIHQKEGGIYHWLRMAFGEKVAFLGIWLQWINTMVWYPTILSFIAGTGTFLFDSKLAQNKIYLSSVILLVFWILTFLNLRGLKTSARFSSVCAIVGMIIPMLFIITLAAIYVMSGNPLQLHFTWKSLIPNLKRKEIWISLTAIMTSFLGMELATVHVRDIDNAKNTFPKALFYSVIIIATTMFFGSLAIACVLPAKQIELVNGVMQAFSDFFHHDHIKWMIPVIALALLVGSLGGMINWIISPAKGLMQAANQGYLPPFFSKENQHSVPSHLLLIQAVFVSLLCLVFLLMPSVNSSYWLLTDLSTQIYMLMYLLMFFSALVIHHKFRECPRNFSIPGGGAGKWLTCLFGITGCLITIVIGFFPPPGIDFGGTFHYEIMFSSGMLIVLLPTLFFYTYKYVNTRKLF